VWFGHPSEEPACPAQASVLDYKGYADLNASALSCPTCQCEPSTGTCSPPRKITFNLHECNLPGKEVTIYAPADWDGSCDSTNLIPPGMVCPNGDWCVLSVNMSSIDKIDSCAAVAEPSTRPEAVAPHWQTLALICGGSSPAHESACHDPEQTCAASALPAAANFRRCIYKDGDDVCPAGSYTEKHLFHGSYNDARSCSACQCSPPKDSRCLGTVKFYEDPFCTGIPFSAVASDYWLGSKAESYCFTGALGFKSLGSKRVESAIYQTGTCEPSGGEPEGEISPVEPTTICCLPEEPESPAP
jgi:hypothetical protein